MVSRQREWQLRMKAKGLCVDCGKAPSLAGATMCAECGTKRIEKKRDRRGYKGTNRGRPRKYPEPK